MDRGRGAKVLGPKAGTVDEAKATAAAAVAKGPDDARRTGKSSAADRPGSRGRSITPEGSESGSASGSSSSAATRGESAGSRGGESQRGSKDKKSKDKGGSKPDKAGARPVADSGIFATLPKLKGVPAQEQAPLLEQKMQACKVIFDFLTDKDLGEKEGKKHTLSELVEHVTAHATCLDENVLTLALDMSGSNIFRALSRRERSHLDLLDQEDDSPIFDAAWPHLELVYELLLRVVKNSDASLLGKLLDKHFLLKLLELFDSEDPRERESLKTLINKIYTRLSGLRTFIRKGIHSICLRVIYENGTPSGVAELLEVLARIITGFQVPLKPDHRDLFFRALVPLHKLETLGLYHSQLVECQRKFIEKDSSLALDTVNILFRFWPVSVANKQVLFLNELEDILVEIPSSQLPKVQEKLAKRLAACVSCQNSDVAERALNLCKNSRVTKLIIQHCRTQFPIVISSLYDNATAHWANPVHKLTIEVLKLLMETDPELFDQSSATHRKQAGEADLREAERERRWALLRQLHDRKRSRSAGRRRAPSAPRTAGTGNATAAAAAASTAGGGGTGNAVAGDSDAPVRSASSKEAAASLTQSASSTTNMSRLVCPRPGSPPLVLSQNCELLLPGSRYGVMACWDSKLVGVELGFQALMVDKRGKIISAVHDGNSFALQGAVCHTRTEPEAGRTLVDSTVWVKPPRLPQVVVLLILVAVAYSGGHLSDVPDAVIKLVEESPDSDVAHFDLTANRGDVGPVACFKRSDGGWSLIRTEEFVRNKRHFMDILEPTLGKLIREFVPSVPKRHKTKLAFGAMEQGALATLPQPALTKWLFVSIGWDIGQAASELEVSVAGVFLDEKAQEMGAVSAEKTEHCGARHCGGGVLGEGMVFDLEAVPHGVQQVALLVNLRGEDTSFEMVQKPHCSVVDPTGAELMRYTHTEVASESGLILARLLREAGRGRWALQALGATCSGTHWKDSMQDIQTIAQKAPHELRTVLDDVKSSSDTKRSIVSL